MTKEIAIGRMSRAMTVEHVSALPDAGGGTEMQWEEVAENPVIHVQNLQVKAAERLRFAQASRQVTHKIATRSHPALRTGNRLVDAEGTAYRITETEQHDRQGAYVICYLELMV